MVDCGAGISIYDALGQAPDFKGINPDILHILLTHGHRDHITGLLKMFKYCGHKGIPVHGSPFTIGVWKNILRELYFSSESGKEMNYNELARSMGFSNSQVHQLIVLWKQLAPKEEYFDDLINGSRKPNGCETEEQQWAFYFLEKMRDLYKRLNQWEYIEEPKSSIPVFGNGFFEAGAIDLSGCHSIHQPLGYWVKMDGKLFVHLGDLKCLPVGWQPPYEWQGKKPDVLFLDSTGAFEKGHSPDETTLNDLLYEKDNPSKLINRANFADNKRLIIVLFSTNIPRILNIIDMAHHCSRSVGVVGRSLNQMMKLAQKVEEESRGKYGDILKTAWDGVNWGSSREDVVITTGTQGEPGSGLYKLVAGRGEHSLQEGDIIIVSARELPGTHINEVLRQAKDDFGDLIYILRDCRANDENSFCEERVDKDGNTYKDIDDYGPSGHAYREDLEDMIRMINPRFVFPIHGDLDRRKALRSLANSMKIDALGVPKIDDPKEVEKFNKPMIIEL